MTSDQNGRSTTLILYFWWKQKTDFFVNFSEFWIEIFMVSHFKHLRISKIYFLCVKLVIFSIVLCLLGGRELLNSDQDRNIQFEGMKKRMLKSVINSSEMMVTITHIQKEVFWMKNQHLQLFGYINIHDTNFIEYSHFNSVEWAIIFRWFSVLFILKSA